MTPLSYIAQALPSALYWAWTDLALLLRGRIRLDQLVDDPEYLSVYRASLSNWRAILRDGFIPGNHITPAGVAHMTAFQSCDQRQLTRVRPPLGQLDRPPLTFIVVAGEPLPYPASTRS